MHACAIGIYQVPLQSSSGYDTLAQISPRLEHEFVKSATTWYSGRSGIMSSTVPLHVPGMCDGSSISNERRWLDT
jgi:hypothetical protein